MHLTQEQIQFIEDYLIKNKVKSWDIRLELLDHIASDIQIKMEKGLSFLEALETTHQKFGNKLLSKKLSKDQKKWEFTKGIYADNSGYKKLMLDKQREWSKQLRSLHWNELKMLFKNVAFLLVYIILGFGLFNLMQSDINQEVLQRIVIIPFLILVCVPLLMSLSYFKKVHRHSIHLNLLGTLPLMGITLFNFLIYIPKLFGLNNTENIDSRVLLTLYIVGVPLVISSITLYKSQLEKYRKLFLKWKVVN